MLMRTKFSHDCSWSGNGSQNGREFGNLVTSNGKPTEYGEMLGAESGMVLETGSSETSQDPSHEGNIEYITMRYGADRIIRRYDSAMSRCNKTAISKEFFGIEWVTLQIRRHSKQWGEIYASRVISLIRLRASSRGAHPAATGRKNQEARLGSLSYKSHCGEDSTTIQEGREWRIVEMTTTPGGAGETPQTDVRERPLVGHPCVSSLPMDEHIVAKAFQSTMTNCVARARSWRYES